MKIYHAYLFLTSDGELYRNYETNQYATWNVKKEGKTHKVFNLLVNLKMCLKWSLFEKDIFRIAQTFKALVSFLIPLENRRVPRVLCSVDKFNPGAIPGNGKVILETAPGGE